MRYQVLALLFALGGTVVGCGGEDKPPAPDTFIDVQPDALTNDPNATFFFRAGGAITDFQCSFDGAAPFSCSSPVMMALPDGEHTFTVAAVLNTEVDDTPASYTWRIDTNPPDTEITDAPPSLDNDAAPIVAFSGTDDEGEVTFECSLDGATPSPCTSPDTLAVTDGTHSFAVTAVDAAGNRDPSPATHGWEVNTSTPNTAITAGPTEGSTTADAVTFAFSTPDPNATFECDIDGGGFTACTTPLDFTALADGSHTFTVRAVGIAGADPSPPSVTWNVDAVPPTATITSGPSNPSNVTTPQFAFTADETATFECQIDGVTTFTACTSPFQAMALSDGAQTFRVRPTDTVGNVGNDVTFLWVVDTVAPTVTITSQPPAISNDQHAERGVHHRR